MCVERKVVVKVLERNGFERINRTNTKRGLGSSHIKYQRTNEDGTTTSYSLNIKKTLEKKIIHDISRVTGIPKEVFYRSVGSKKHRNGLGTFGLFRGSFN